MLPSFLIFIQIVFRYPALTGISAHANNNLKSEQNDRSSFQQKQIPTMTSIFDLGVQITHRHYKLIQQVTYLIQKE